MHLLCRQGRASLAVTSGYILTLRGTKTCWALRTTLLQGYITAEQRSHPPQMCRKQRALLTIDNLEYQPQNARARQETGISCSRNSDRPGSRKPSSFIPTLSSG